MTTPNTTAMPDLIRIYDTKRFIPLEGGGAAWDHEIGLEAVYLAGQSSRDGEVALWKWNFEALEADRERLIAEVSSLKNSEGAWISASERMPDERDKREDTNCFIAWPMSEDVECQYVGTAFYDQEWLNSDDGTSAYVTHWRPLPKPPTASDEKV